MNTRKIEQRVIELIEEKIADRPDLFIIDVKMHPDGKLIVLVDGDKGIAIQDCAAISRYVGYQLEENNDIEQAYNLEVSSPGLDTPFKLLRQYQKNINRNVSVKTIDGLIYEGKLEDASETEIWIDGKLRSGNIKEEKAGKGKKIQGMRQCIPFNQIAETKVLISFK